uniref:Peptidyl-tRNA hydrolase family protein n=1 Tax=Tanacetum cinerariifolium TaxID=118510 RepID=A0A6L2NVY1_TANCI|nr:peptidyl-tRNA hydrolase family protein [Tanacetum cinerariifolium]
MAKAKENVLSVEIQIISSENVRNYQDIIIKRRLLEDLGVIATKMKKRRQRTKSVLWLKLPMRIECAKANPTANLPYCMFLTRLYRYIMETYPHLDNGTYDSVEQVIRPFALRQTRRPRSDHGKVRRSVSSSSSHHQGMSSHQHDDDDVETSRASTPSPSTYFNSLNPLNYQNYQIPSSSEQINETLFARQITLLNQTQRMHEEMRGGFK